MSNLCTKYFWYCKNVCYQFAALYSLETCTRWFSFSDTTLNQNRSATENGTTVPKNLRASSWIKATFCSELVLK